MLNPVKDSCESDNSERVNSVSVKVPASYPDETVICSVHPKNNFSVTVPPFWPDDPEPWFTHLERQFALANITVDLTKYSYVVANLDCKYLTVVKNVIQNPPAKNNYEEIKKELIRHISSMQEERTHQMLSREEIGDRKPSQFLQYLRSLAKPIISNDMIRPLWLSRLPVQIQAIIASQKSSSLDDLATLADNISDVIGQSHVNQVPEASSEIHDLKKCVDELTRKVRALTASSRFRGRGRYRSRSTDSSL